ncbi:MAG: hypothetical protein Q4P29_04155 [Tissierellia bacterium]|nr:hypothetical protein [Tissierellia bacterium]
MKRLVTTIGLAVLSIAILTFLSSLVEDTSVSNIPKYELYSLEEIVELDKLNGDEVLIREIPIDEDTDLILYVRAELSKGNIVSIPYAELTVRNLKKNDRIFKVSCVC